MKVTYRKLLDAIGELPEDYLDMPVSIATIDRSCPDEISLMNCDDLLLSDDDSFADETIEAFIDADINEGAPLIVVYC